MLAYCFYDMKYHAIKIGVAQVPAERMVAYSVEYDLRPEPKSLVQVDIPQHEAVHIHNRIIQIFIEGLDLKPVEEFAELFSLGHAYQYAEIRQLFEIVVRDIVMFVTTRDDLKRHRLRRLTTDRVIEWKNINDGGAYADDENED